MTETLNSFPTEEIAATIWRGIRTSVSSDGMPVHCAMVNAPVTGPVSTGWYEICQDHRDLVGTVAVPAYTVPVFDFRQKLDN
jgi:hypothetical protein